MHYILVNKKPVPVYDLLEWARKFEVSDRRVKLTKLRLHYVSTVFLGLDHNFNPNGKPLLFETMVFKNRISELDFNGRKVKINKSVDKDGYFARYSSYANALKGHANILRLVKKLEKK